MSLLKKSIEEAPVVKKGDYEYVVHPLTDGVPEIKPELLDEVVTEMEKHLTEKQPVDRIVTVEAMGIPLATALSLKTGIPFTIIRKREYGLPGEVSVQQVTGYSKSTLFINGINQGDRIVIVDDVLSTGGTLKAVLQSFKEIGVVVKAVIIAINKGEVAEQIQKTFGIPIISIATITVKDGIVQIKQ
ncbi:MAG TPA: purine phosphoribosyltransferase family protein [Thermoplasmatales archaeon]|nr:purine phosphoribosyltransferase family protein [Thermoplasmatales archaeon]